MQSRLPEIAQDSSALRKSPLNDRSTSMQKPPPSDATPTIPGRQDAGAFVEITPDPSSAPYPIPGCVITSLTGGLPPPPICTSVTVNLAVVEPTGVVTSIVTSPSGWLKGTVTGTSSRLGLPAYAPTSIAGALSFTFAPTRFLPSSFRTV